MDIHVCYILLFVIIYPNGVVETIPLTRKYLLFKHSNTILYRILICRGKWLLVVVAIIVNMLTHTHIFKNNKWINEFIIQLQKNTNENINYEELYVIYYNTINMNAKQSRTSKIMMNNI